MMKPTIRTFGLYFILGVAFVACGPAQDEGLQADLDAASRSLLEGKGETTPPSAMPPPPSTSCLNHGISLTGNLAGFEIVACTDSEKTYYPYPNSQLQDLCEKDERKVVVRSQTGSKYDYAYSGGNLYTRDIASSPKASDVLATSSLPLQNSYKLYAARYCFDNIGIFGCTTSQLGGDFMKARLIYSTGTGSWKEDTIAWFENYQPVNPAPVPIYQLKENALSLLLRKPVCSAETKDYWKARLNQYNQQLATVVLQIQSLYLAYSTGQITQNEYNYAYAQLSALKESNIAYRDEAFQHLRDCCVNVGLS